MRNSTSDDRVEKLASPASVAETMVGAVFLDSGLGVTAASLLQCMFSIRGQCQMELRRRGSYCMQPSLAGLPLVAYDR